MLIGFQKEEWEKAYEDWVKLLKVANAEEEMLSDPKAIWDEAWRQVTFISWAIIEAKVPPQYRQDVLDALKLRLMK
jgi:hypothetical protein